MRRGLFVLGLLLAALAGSGCLGLGRSATTDAAKPDASETVETPARSAAPESPAAEPATSAPDPAEEPDDGAEIEEAQPTWTELTRLAREDQRRGDLESADRRLEQAALQVAPLAPSQAPRRTVFGMRARLAREMALSGETERAEALTDRLLEEVEAEPVLGGTALVSLSLLLTDPRPDQTDAEAESGESEPDTRRLRLLRAGLIAAESRPANRDRLRLAIRTASEAQAADDLPLARRAIDRAIADSEMLAPSRRDRLAALRLQRAEIAEQQGDLDVAAADATRSNQIFDEIEASASWRGIGEARLAEILAKQGDDERALAIARGALARLSGDEPIDPEAERVILGALARVERARGDLEQARRHYREALDVPGQGGDSDARLVRALGDELAELDAEPAPAPPAFVQ